MRIVIADDHPVVRDGVRSVIESYDEYQVCGEATNGLEAVKQTLDCNPNMVILDISMPVMNGLDAARKIHEKRPGRRSSSFLCMSTSIATTISRNPAFEATSVNRRRRMT